jgi:RHS repeat-associated protein
LRRPIRAFVKGADPQQSDREILFERTVYGESHPDPKKLNLRGKVYMQFDGAGVVINQGKHPQTDADEAYDYKGNLLRSIRRLAREYIQLVDWSAVEPLLDTVSLNLSAIEAALTPLLETDSFKSSTTYDALNRPVTLTMPDNSVIKPKFNEANLLNAVRANLRSADMKTEFARNIDYDAKGQRTLIEYGNGVKTGYKYDEKTFRLIHLETTRGSNFSVDERTVQDLHYTYDPVGNITAIRDAAQQTIYFRNHRVEPSNEYTYDAIYRLIQATGREHLGQAGDGSVLSPTPASHTDEPRVGLLHRGDDNAMGGYMETYQYDAVGNILKLIHAGTDPQHPGWTREYTYNEPNLIEPTTQKSNRLSSTTVGTNNPITEPYAYDEHGNMTRMPHLSSMQWDYKDQLQATSKQVVNNGDTPEITYYVYDAAGQRVRKVTKRQNNTRKDERIYLGGFEIYHRYNGNGATIQLKRETLHIMDDKRRIALVETKTVDVNVFASTLPSTLIRYQFDNHLGSACLELGSRGGVISYEEYYPYGSTSYQAGRSAAEVSLKRYRYTGKERDEETGLCYHGARYYVPWLGRWTSCDPAGMVGGVNCYEYTRNNPLNVADSTGAWPEWLDKKLAQAEQALQSVQDKAQQFAQKSKEALEQMATGAARAGAQIAQEAFNLTTAGQVISGVQTISQLHTPEGREKLKEGVNTVLRKLYKPPKFGS